MAHGEQDLARDRRVRQRVTIQRARLFVFGLSGGIALALRIVGALEITYAQLALIAGAMLGSAAAHMWLAIGDREHRWGVDLAPLWMAADVAGVSGGVYFSGGIDSPWVFMYAANVWSVGFVAGRWLALAVLGINTLAYILVLWAMGDVAWADASMYQALARMAVLGGALWLTLLWTDQVRARSKVFRDLRDAESRKVDELARLTVALDERTAQLKEANAKIRRADRLKSQFLANMSHELRTPLNSIIGFSEILRTRATGLDPRHAEFLDHVHGSGRHLLRLINDILDLSKVEAGKLELDIERVSVSGLVEGVCSVVQGAASARGIAIEPAIETGLPLVEADAVRLKQILFNLLSNAVKFSPDRAKVELAARWVDEDDSPLQVESIELEVCDHGIGIAAEDQRLIFQEFHQLDGAGNRQHEGTGLGLSLVERFVTLHRGRIDLASAPGEGSSFRVILPAEQADLGPPAMPTLSPDLPVDPRRSVLVVEDDPTYYESLATAFAAADVRCVRAANGEQALRIAACDRPDAITLDIVLPGIDGWDVLKRLKSEPGTREIPVIVLSVLDNRELAHELGALASIVKPADPDAVVSCVLGAEVAPAVGRAARG